MLIVSCAPDSVWPTGTVILLKFITILYKNIGGDLTLSAKSIAFTRLPVPSTLMEATSGNNRKNSLQNKDLLRK